MRRRYIVFYEGKSIGWVHAVTAEQAIRKVSKVTGHLAEDCTALPINVTERPTIKAIHKPKRQEPPATDSRDGLFSHGACGFYAACGRSGSAGMIRNPVARNRRKARSNSRC
jgi:hypothetical protein